MRAALSRAAFIAGAAIGLATAINSAEACVFVAPVFTLGGTSAAVCESIFPNFVPGGGGTVAWDYRYYLLNTGAPGAASIEFFGAGVNAPLPAGGTVPSFSSQQGVTFPVGNFNFFGLAGNASVFFLNGQSNWPGWQFDEYTALAAGLPVGYFLDWNAVGAGALPGAPIPVGAVGAMPPGFYTEFDLYSPFGPVAGSGLTDPMYIEAIGGPLVAISDTTLDTDIADAGGIGALECLGPAGNSVPSQTITENFQGQSDTSGGSETGTPAACTAPTNAQLFGSDPVPEPSSLALLAACLTALGAYRRARA